MKSGRGGRADPKKQLESVSNQLPRSSDDRQTLLRPPDAANEQDINDSEAALAASMTVRALS